MFDYLHIVFNHSLDLCFRIDKTVLAALWLERMNQRHQWPLDDPSRFYGFDSLEQEKQKAESQLQQCIDTINRHDKIIDRELSSIQDQDYLNYLHNIFEKYHGLLDQQNTIWWQSAPIEVQKALADLNIAVHRAESVAAGTRPRFVCTWFGMPKHLQLDQQIIEAHGSTLYQFGGVYLNYVEIGKTLEDLSRDNDHYIGQDAFKPFLHYSADFSVRFYDQSADLDSIDRYFHQHREFFMTKNIHTPQDYRAMPYRFRVAQLESTWPRSQIIELIAQNQLITDIYFQ
jgi:hypothetical protein